MIVIIADDLTGANDTGVQYVKNGYKTLVKIAEYKEKDSDLPMSSDVLVINTDTRQLSSENAYEMVFEIGKKIKEIGNVEYIYKKVDSLMRGNPAPELEAILDATEAEIAIVASAFPDNGRIVTEGTLLMNDNKKVDITNIFNTETRRKAIGVRLLQIREGAESLKTFMETQMTKGTSILVFDTVSNEDLAIISDAAMLIKDKKKVFCGSAGLAKQLGRKKKALAKYEGKTCIVVGSRNATTANQVRLAKETFNCSIVLIDSKKLTSSFHDHVVEDTVKRAKEVFEKGGEAPVIIPIDSLFEDYTMVLRESSENSQKSLVIAEALGKITKELYNQVKPLNIVATGGDTAFQICSALESDGMELIDEILPGVPIGVLSSGMARGSSMVTKSGGFGEDDTFVKVINYLKINSR